MVYSDKQLQSYLNELTPDRPRELQIMEAYAAENNFPIIGPAAGHFCYLIARLVKARRVFELGSGYGYSTAWFARAVDENGGGDVFHTVRDEELSRMARQHLQVLGYDDLMHYRVSESIEALRETDGPFDLIFSDINKQAYPESLQVIADKLRSGGVLIVDNLLFSGRVFDEDNDEASTVAIRAFTDLLTNSEEWVSSIIPIRDGLALAYKR